MKKSSDEIFDCMLEEAKSDPGIVGFFLGGSRGKGLANEYSDYDVYIIVKDSRKEFFKRKYPFKKHENMDFILYTLSEFKRHAYWGGPEEYNRYNFTHIKVLVDKNGRIQKLVDEKAKIPKDKIRPFISGTLDGYINFVYRSLKCLRDGNMIGARLEAATSINLFFDAVFALDGGRLRPYYKYLQWELERFPLKSFPMKTKDILDNVSKIIGNADMKAQQKLLLICEKIFKRAGYTEVFDNWEKLIKIKKILNLT